jgi:16S rRNA (adenine(1408)-N(1))-methyltransferase
VIALDANPAGLRDASRHAPANALFVRCAAEAMPAELNGIATLLTIQFPWGSLLRGASGADPRLTHRLAALVAPGGRVQLLLASAAHDARGGQTAIDPAEVAAAWHAAGMRLTEARVATLADAAAAHSSWGKRLLRNPGPGRSAWHIGMQRPPANGPGRL